MLAEWWSSPWIARKFASDLAERYRMTVSTVDERLTSAEAANLLRDRRRQGLTQRVRRGDVDSLAAQLIAESWLHSNRG